MMNNSKGLLLSWVLMSMPIALKAGYDHGGAKAAAAKDLYATGRASVFSATMNCKKSFPSGFSNHADCLELASLGCDQNCFTLQLPLQSDMEKKATDAAKKDK